jgi:hypothetical protein
MCLTHVDVSIYRVNASFMEWEEEVVEHLHNYGREERMN